MLTKLLKYDLKKIFKFISVFFALALFFALLSRLFRNLGDSLMLLILTSICNGAAISMMFSILINCLMRSWVLFRNTLYADESYLTHTLPVKRETLYASKAITGLLTLLASFAWILLTLAVMYCSTGTLDTIRAFLSPFAAMFDVSTPVLVSVFLLILFLEFFAILQWGFLGIVTGHRLNRGKVGFSVLFGFAAYLLAQVFQLLLILIVALTDSSVMEVFRTSDFSAISVNAAQTVVIVGVAGYLILLTLGYVLNRTLLKRGVNVD